MSIEGNIVYVLQTFPRKKRVPTLFWDRSPPSLFHAIWTGYRFFFPFTGGERLAHVIVSHGLDLQNEGLSLFDW